MEAGEVRTQLEVTGSEAGEVRTLDRGNRLGGWRS